jgi:hypothetical protein
MQVGMTGGITESQLNSIRQNSSVQAPNDSLQIQDWTAFPLNAAASNFPRFGGSCSPDWYIPRVGILPPLEMNSLSIEGINHSADASSGFYHGCAIRGCCHRSTLLGHPRLGLQEMPDLAC